MNQKKCLLTVLPIWLLIILMGIEFAHSSDLRIEKDKDHYRVEVTVDDTLALNSPTEGLWSIAYDWRNEWPADWRHAHPSEVITRGEWTIMKGELKSDQGTWQLSDSYRKQGERIQCIRRFEWHGDNTLEQCTLSVRYQTPGTGKRVFMPGILYYGNPSGARSGKVPVYNGQAGEESFYEEHRFPMPFVSLEWQKKQQWRGVAMHSLPSPVPHGNLPDQWWSMGITALKEGSELALLSGPCASNGQRSVIKAIQPGFVSFPGAYLSIPPGRIIEKTFYLEAFPVEREGSGFQQPIQTSLDLFQPYSLDGLPTFKEIIQAKYRFSKTRWHRENGAAGFKKYPDRDFFVIGWCGQAAAPGYALQGLGDELDDPAITRYVQDSLDFLSNAKFYDKGFHTWYNYETNEWSRHEPLSQGQGMLNMAHAIKLAREGNYDSSKWEAFLKKAASFHANRIMQDNWKPESTNEAFFIAPLCYAYRFFDDERFLKAAVKAGHHYARRHVDMKEPYWGGTLDASCEDKEGAFAALQGFLELYETTGEPHYLEWAEHACDVAISYVVVWDIDMPPGRLRDHFFKTRGWTVVSPQNQHIDVFGVLIAPDVYRVGKHLKRNDLKRLAEVMYRSCGQLIDPYGSQGEQPQHTNYTQHGKADDIYALRGGYNETWTVFWITAHFLNAAAQFKELGVPIWD